jgi:hypothetical protein
MKNLAFAASIVVILSACSTTPSDTYEKRAYEERQRNEVAIERSLEKAPKWMTTLPKSTSAVYANGSAVSRDFSMADEKAKLIALAHICMAAGGEVDKSSKIFMSDTETSSTERSETAIRSMCRRVDVSGAEVAEIARISENGRYRTYILMALPTGDANAIVKRNDARRNAEAVKTRADDAFKELDNKQ